MPDTVLGTSYILSRWTSQKAYAIDFNFIFSI